MAPRNKNFLTALLVVAFAVCLLQPSAAIRIPPLIPCIPGLPKIPFIPCYEPSPPSPPLKTPSECLTPLMKMMPCAEYLTNNASVPKPPSACCKGFDSIVNSGEGICFCHVGNGDIGQLLPAPLNISRLFRLTAGCDNAILLEPYAECDMGEVPPMTLPTPPPSPGKKAAPPPAS